MIKKEWFSNILGNTFSRCVRNIVIDCHLNSIKIDTCELEHGGTFFKTKEHLLHPISF